MRKHVVFHWP